MQGKNVVVGNLVYSLVLGMSVPDVSGSCIANLEVESLLHRSPTFHGDTIYAETRVLAATPSKSKDDRGIVTVETKAFNQRGEEVCYFRRKLMVWKAAAAPAVGAPTPTTSGTQALSASRARRLHSRILEWGDANRRALPWRTTTDPWAILVSEVMLAQTQVDRVIPYYLRFLERFGDPATCARARPRRWCGCGRASATTAAPSTCMRPRRPSWSSTRIGPERRGRALGTAGHWSLHREGHSRLRVQGRCRTGRYQCAPGLVRVASRGRGCRTTLLKHWVIAWCPRGDHGSSIRRVRHRGDHLSGQTGLRALPIGGAVSLEARRVRRNRPVAGRGIGAHPGTFRGVRPPGSRASRSSLGGPGARGRTWCRLRVAQ